MSGYKIVMATQSWYGSPGANFIQVSQNAIAFAKLVRKVQVIFRDDGRREQEFSFPENVDLEIISVNRGFLGSIIYLYRQILIVLTARRESTLLVYTRSIPLAFFLSVLGEKRVALELHQGIRDSFDLIALKLISARQVLICISKAIVENLEKNKIRADNTLVAPDGHSFSISKNRALQSSRGLNVGYFGSLSPQKGLNLIIDLTQSNQSKYQFNIYSKDSDLIPDSDSIGECKFIAHSSCFEMMNRQDVLLLFVVPQGLKRDISPYTSPLKLFEYLSTGKTIIASDLPIIREVLTNEENALLVPNDARAVFGALDRLTKNADLVLKIHSNSLIAAETFTWNKRAGKILEFMENHICN